MTKKLFSVLLSVMMVFTMIPQLGALGMADYAYADTAIPAGAPFTDVTADVAGTVTVTDTGEEVSYSGWGGDSYTAPLYLVTVPEGTTTVTVKVLKDEVFWETNDPDVGECVYGYGYIGKENDLNDWTYGMQKFLATSDDDYVYMKMNVADFLEEDDKQGGPETDMASGNKPVCAFTFKYGEGGDPPTPDPTWTIIVNDVNGSPITGYTATLMHEDDNYNWQTFEEVTNTKEDGSVSFYREIPQGDWGHYKLIVTKDGYEDLTFDGGWGGWDYEEWPENPKTLTMTAAGVKTKKVTVTVVDDETGEEVEGAVIKLYNEALNPRQEVARDVDGNWYLEVNNDYFFYAEATAEGYEEGRSSSIFARDTTAEEVTIRLVKAVDPLQAAKDNAKAALAEYKQDEDFADADAVQEIRDSYSQQIDEATSEEEINDLLDEAKDLIDQKPLNPPAPYHTLIVKDEDTDEEIETFTAEIWDLRKADSDVLGSLFETAEDGKFYNKDFDTKWYKLKVTAEGYEDYLSEDSYEGYSLKNGSVTLPAVVKLSKKQPVFTLAVKNAKTGEAIDNFTATVYEKKYPNDFTEFETSTDGKFYKSWDKWNDYKYTVSAEGFVEKTVEVPYTGQDYVYPSEIELEPEPVVTAIVKDKALGTELTGFVARLEYAYDGNYNNWQLHEESIDGKFYEPLEESYDYEYRLVVEKDGYQTYTMEPIDYQYWYYDDMPTEFTVELKNSLVAAKEAAKAELEEYRNSKEDSDYDEAGVEELNSAKTAGDEAIDAAENEAAVAEKLQEAKDAIDAVKTKAQKQAEADKQAAEDAAAEADEAKQVADTAKGAAETAKEEADAAAQKAAESKQAADEAAETPGQAAVDAAKQAKDDAQDAADKAAAAKDAADTAKEKAEEAKAKADAAKEAADKAVESAAPEDKAALEEAAREAATKANEAAQAAQTAEEVANKAEEDKEAAEQALSDAEEALTNAEKARDDKAAADKKAEEEAKKKAEEDKKKAAEDETKKNADDRKNQKGEDGTALGKGASLEAAEAALAAMTSDGDPAGTKFAPLYAQSKKTTKSSAKVTWKKVSGAKKYILCGNKCGKKNKMKKIKELSGKSFNVKKVDGKKLKKKTSYKFIVIAVDGSNNVVSTSKIVHVMTKSGKNYTKVKVTAPKSAKKGKLSLKAGKTAKLKAKAVGKKVKNHRKVMFESLDTNIATVNAKTGKVKAVKKGKVKINVYAQNGVYKTVKVTVK